MPMPTFLGFAPAGVMFLIGLMGLMHGWLPGLTIARVSGWNLLRLRIAALLLTAALPVCVFLGTLSSEAARLSARLEAEDQVRSTLLEKGAKADPATLRREVDRRKQDDEALRDAVTKELAELDRYRLCFERLFFSAVLLIAALHNIPTAAKISPLRPTDPARSANST